jgi:hypothetical protein
VFFLQELTTTILIKRYTITLFLIKYQTRKNTPLSLKEITQLF